MYTIGRGMAWSSGGVAILEATGRALPMSAPHAGLRAPRCDRPPRPGERFASPVSIAFGHVAAAHHEAPPHRGTGVRTAHRLPCAALALDRRCLQTHRRAGDAQ